VKQATRITLHPTRTPRLTDFQAYALAAGLMPLSIVITRLGWPVFWRVPFAPMFLCIYLVARWGTKRAGLLAVAIGAIGSLILSPSAGAPPFLPPALALFTAVSLIAVHVVTDRNRMLEALQASEAHVTARCQAEADLRRSEEKLRHAQKMEAVGQLVAGVSHNFNNILTIMMAYTDLLLERHQDADDRAELEEIKKATERGAALTRQLLLFSRRAETRAKLIDLNTVMAALREILAGVIREDVRLKIELPSEPPTILMDWSDFEHIVLNLVINARDAMPRGGNVRIGIARRIVAPDDIRPNRPIAPGDYVCVEIQDDGVGMTPEIQAHLFEPFFTTKEVGEGTGLGLAAVYGMVRDHHGYIEVESAPGGGTTITLFFPYVDPALMSPADVVEASDNQPVLTGAHSL
jgi:signal transduction histidine kinase